MILWRVEFLCRWIALAGRPQASVLLPEADRNPARVHRCRVSCGVDMQMDLTELMAFVVLIAVAIWLGYRALRIGSSRWKKGPE